jgi:lysophospholipase L1-like esterase
MKSLLLLVLVFAGCASLPAGPPLIAVGDSLTVGYTPSGNYHWTDKLGAVNDGVNGRLCQQIIDDVAMDSSFQAGGKLILWCGTNDIHWQYKAEDILGAVSKWSLARKAVGWKVYVVTLQSVQWNNSIRNQVNALLRDHWKDFADGLIDIAALPEIGTDDSFNNPHWFSDGIHLTPAGYDLVRKKIAKELGR